MSNGYMANYGYFIEATIDNAKIINVFDNILANVMLLNESISEADLIDDWFAYLEDLIDENISICFNDKFISLYKHHEGDCYDGITEGKIYFEFNEFDLFKIKPKNLLIDLRKNGFDIKKEFYVTFG